MEKQVRLLFVSRVNTATIKPKTLQTNTKC